MDIFEFILKNDYDNVEHLLKNGVDVNMNNGMALNAAVMKGYNRVAKLLIENGADIHLNNEMVFMTACTFGNIEMAKFLLENGAGEKNSGLISSCAQGYDNIVKFLIENGADLHVHFWNDHPLRFSLTHGYYEIAQLLIENGANLGIISNELIETIMQNRNQKIFDLLNKHGFNII